MDERSRNIIREIGLENNYAELIRNCSNKPNQ